MHHLKLFFILSNYSKFCTLNLFFLLFFKLSDFIFLSHVNLLNHLCTNFLNLFNLRELAHNSSNLLAFDCILVGNNFLTLFEECWFLLLSQGWLFIIDWSSYSLIYKLTFKDALRLQFAKFILKFISCHIMHSLLF